MATSRSCRESSEGWEQGAIALCLLSGHTQEDLRHVTQGGSSATEAITKIGTGAVFGEMLSDPFRKVTGFDTTRIEFGANSANVKLCKKLQRILKACGQGELGFVGGSRVQGDLQLRVSDYFIGLLRVEYLSQGIDTLQDTNTRLKLEFNYRILSAFNSPLARPRESRLVAPTSCPLPLTLILSRLVRLLFLAVSALLLFEGVPRADERVAEVIIEGRLLEKKDKLLRFLGLQPGATFGGQEQLFADLDRLGYRARKFQARPAPDGLHIHLEVEPVRVVRHVIIRGAWPYFEDEIVRHLTLRSGLPLPPDDELRARLDEEAAHVVQFLERDGYFGSKVHHHRAQAALLPGIVAAARRVGGSQDRHLVGQLVSRRCGEGRGQPRHQQRRSVRRVSPSLLPLWPLQPATDA